METKIERMIPSFKEYGVEKAALFGSMARGEDGPLSDVDLVISFAKQNYDLLDIAGLKLSLEDALCLPVDLITYSSLKNDEFSRCVLRDEQVIYEQN